MNEPQSRVRKKRSLRTDVELLRLICAFGIVWLHAGIQHYRDIAAAGLIFFVITSIFFALRTSKSYGIRDRASRLLIPFLIWGVSYGAFFYIVTGSILPKDIKPSTAILASPAIHLWFLPFIFFALVITDRIKDALKKGWVVVIMGIGLTGIIATAEYWRALAIPDPFAQYAHTVPAVLFSYLLYGASFVRKKTVLALFALVFAAVLFEITREVPSVGYTYLLGFILGLVFLKEESLIGSSRFINTLSSASFGIYLFHPFAIMVQQHFGIDGYLLAFTSFLISLLVILSLKAVLSRKITNYLF